MNIINIVFIADDNYIIPTLTAATSIKTNRAKDTYLKIYIVSADLSIENEQLFLSLVDEKTSIDIKHVSAEKYRKIHINKPGSPCVATVAALLKFDLPLILSEIDKVLYLDGDLIVRKDLFELYETNIEYLYLAAVVDSGSIYYKHTYAEKLDKYFNSGVMLLNLREMRRNNVTNELVLQKTTIQDSIFMDQDIFNVVCCNNTYFLPIKYNFLYINLKRAEGQYSINEINEKYGTEYKNIEQIQEDAVIIHFSSKDKPWKNKDVPLGEEWQYYYQKLNIGEEYCPSDLRTRKSEKTPAISVIIPIYNSFPWLKQSMEAIINQTIKNIEIICINDGSTDGSLNLIKEYSNKDNRIRVYSQPNKGQSSARNVGLKMARGDYIYFFDSDDLIEPYALEHLYAKATKDRLELLFFNGRSIFETEELKKRFPVYVTHYNRSGQYPGIYKGNDIYEMLIHNDDYTVQPCLLFYERSFLIQNQLEFCNGIIYEDNLHTLKAFLSAKRVGYLPEQLFIRRVRNGSTMTGQQSYYNFYCYLMCLVKMYDFILNNESTSDVIDTIRYHFNNFSRLAVESFEALEIRDRRIPWTNDKNEKVLLDFIFDRLLLKSSENTIRQMDSEYRIVCPSYPMYRFLLAITFVPRKTYGGIRCLKENGWRYTIRRTLYHLGLVKWKE